MDRDQRQTWTPKDYEALISAYESGLDWKKIASKKGKKIICFYSLFFQHACIAPTHF